MNAVTGYVGHLAVDSLAVIFNTTIGDTDMETMDPFNPKPAIVAEQARIRDKRAMLKVKLKSLADEARTIRKEECKPENKDQRESLHIHRVTVVRQEARATLLAYMFIRGRLRFRQVEPKNRYDTEANKAARIKKIVRMIMAYGVYEATNQPYTLEQAAHALRAWLLEDVCDDSGPFNHK